MTEIGYHPKILVTEDDPSMLEIIAFLLEDEGYRVLKAANAEAALALLQNTTPDLIISDIMMPGMSGYEFFKEIRANSAWARIPFIFLTARGQRGDIRQGMGMGADDYITKPFEPEELLDAVKIRLNRAADAQASLHRISADLQDKIVQALIHEFRTPLALVVGYTELLESSNREMLDMDFETILNGLHAGSRRLSNLVEDFLLLTRINLGDIAQQARSEQQRTSSPEWVVDQIIARFENQAAASNVSLISDHAARGLTIAIGQPELTEIVSRLLDNAIKFSKNMAGQVQLTTHQDGDHWVLAVHDDGIGIPQEAHAWIFEAFRQVDRDKYEQQGSGVGLTIVRGLTEAYGGQVTVESTPEVGSTFTVSIPLAPE
jgi:two-component system sensor histidine kinase/response regulator